MVILPAIDLRNGQVVRLEQGDYDLQTTYSSNPGEIAETFAKAGAKWIHLVDLDAAKSGIPTNTDAVKAIHKAVPDMHLELGGGARSEDTVRRMLDMGVDRVIIGSAALKDFDWFEKLVKLDDLAGKIVLGLDAKGGKLAISGWTQQVDQTPFDIAHRVTGWPLAGIVYTDISRDGMLSGPNIENTQKMIESTDIPIVASGGISCIEDIRQCKQIGCWGTIVGKAWYEGKVDLKQACEL